MHLETLGNRYPPIKSKVSTMGIIIIQSVVGDLDVKVLTIVLKIGVKILGRSKACPDLLKLARFGVGLLLVNLLCHY